MNANLRSYSEIPLIITRSVDCLAHMEYLFGFTGVGIHYTALYQILVNAYEDWHLEVPALPSPFGAGPVVFVRKPRVPIHRFSAAWTIARRINLVAGRGSIRLHSEPLDTLRQLVSLHQGGASVDG